MRRSSTSSASRSTRRASPPSSATSRLVQYPVEFVVTFPRAYHIGFSHGFNCGEAANFGTPKWLTIAKDAAVRRAVMNYLPMLSHQQLLYLLTMSFISRIPRSLLPGVRSSRLRDRQKEERELLVKRAFIEDILLENSLLARLLQRNSSYHAVLWDIESIPPSSKESEPCQDYDAVILPSTGNDSPENDGDIHDANQLSKYICAVDFDLNDDDMAYDFQMDSGTLPCVACGILGFPFMAVVQPSEVGSVDLLVMDPSTVCEESVIHSDRSHVVGVSTKVSSKVEIANEIANEWNISDASLRPRIFCLEHAIEIEELLSSKGRANVLVICHSDFQKIKTHAAVIAEEVAIPFCYTEIPLDNASPEDLNLIDIAIDREEHIDCAEDWTSQLNINLQHCVKVKKGSPSKNVQYLLSLSGLFSEATPTSNATSVKWESRKSRTRRGKKHVLKGKPSVPNEIMEKKTNQVLQMAKTDSKIIQYSRKRYKAQVSAGIQSPVDPNIPGQPIFDNGPKDPEKENNNMTEHGLIGVENNGKSFSEPSALTADHLMVSPSRAQVENSLPSHHESSVIASTPMTENVEAQPIIWPVMGKISGSCHDSEIVGSTSDGNMVDCAAEIETVPEEEAKTVAREICDQIVENNCDMPHTIRSHSYDAIREASARDGSSNYSCVDGPPSRCDDEQMEGISDQHAVDSEVSKSSSFQEQGHFHRDDENNQKNVTSTARINDSTSPLIEEHFEGETHLAVGSHDDNKDKIVSLPENKVSEDSNTETQSKSTIKTGSKRKREPVLHSEDQFHFGDFIKSPCEGLRSRVREDTSCSTPSSKKPVEEKKPSVNKSRIGKNHSSVPSKNKKEREKLQYWCELDGCSMGFRTKAELLLHEGNRCPVKGCGKKFNSHKYALQHQRVHDDERPLKCPWNGCTMSFKWAWARTEHLRVHTGERPYACKVKGCGLTFRFVSDFSRHRRKTGHSP